MHYLITGGSGYFGGLLKRKLLAAGHHCVNADLDKDQDQLPNLISLQGDIGQKTFLENIFFKYGPFDCVFHAAAQLQLTRNNKDLFYRTNIDATHLLAQNCIKYKTPNFVFISSNCVYGKVNEINITEDYSLAPFEEYGKAKVASENILLSCKEQLNSIILRPPTIIGEGRLGILSIVFDFIKENRKIWLIGSGNNRYQFIYADDLVRACELAAQHPKSEIYNIGCDDVPSLNELFMSTIQAAHSNAKLYHLPHFPFIPAMKLCYKLGISPLGPYQYNMIANTFIGNTNKIKQELSWRPSKSNIEMFIQNYNHYLSCYEELHANQQLTGHRKIGKAGILNLIKMFS